jgi:hypothetical protein
MPPGALSPAIAAVFYDWIEAGAPLP